MAMLLSHPSLAAVAITAAAALLVLLTHRASITRCVVTLAVAIMLAVLIDRFMTPHVHAVLHATTAAPTPAAALLRRTLATAPPIVRFAPWALLGGLIGLIGSGPRPRDVYLRGARVDHTLRRTSRIGFDALRAPPARRLRFGGCRLTPQDETKHFKLLGTTGAGKSTAIRDLLAQALARGDRAIIADPDGGYAARFFDAARGDVILNPFDARSAAWDLFAEVTTPFDVDQLARALIADAGDATANEWRGYARTFLTAVIRATHRDTACPRSHSTNFLDDESSGGADRAAEVATRPSDFTQTTTHRLLGRPTPSWPTPNPAMQRLWERLSQASTEELREVVRGTAAQPFLEPANVRMFGSIRSVSTSAAAALAYLAEQRAPPFSIRRWIEAGRSGTPNPRATGVLFIPYTANQIAALRNVVATWLRLAIFETMNGPEDQDQRLWFVVDELDALGTIDGLKDALARLRKFGGRCVLGFQSIAQVRATYGDAEARTIVENCGNTMILRCSASEGGGTARFASQLIGEREVRRRQIGESQRVSWFDAPQRSRNTSEHHVTESAVLASEIEQLADLTAYVKLASSDTWYRQRIARR